MKFREIMGALCAAGLMCGVVGAVQAAEAGRSVALVDVRRRIESRRRAQGRHDEAGLHVEGLRGCRRRRRGGHDGAEDAGDLGQRADAPRRSRVR